MSQEPFRGVFTIPSTSFHEDLEIDWEGVRRIVDFCVDCGAHGIVWPVNASGFPVLTDEERLKGFEVVIDQVGGRIPVILGVQGVSGKHASMFSRRAKEVAADGVIAMAPYVQELEDENAVLNYYREIDQEIDVPIFIQNHIRGSVLSIDTMVRILNEVEHVEYVKEETFPATHMITGLNERGGDKLKGVFGGAGGRYLLQEYPRGVAGQMPGCHVTDVVVQLWNALDSGNLTEAKRVYGLMAPLFALETLKGSSYPEVLRRRGVIDGVRSRLTTEFPTQDEYDHAALDDALRDLEPLFTWSNGAIRYGAPPSFTKKKGKQTASSGGAAVDTFDRVG